MAKKILKLSTPESVNGSDEIIDLLRNDELHKDHPVQMTVGQATKLLAMQERKGWKHYSLPADSKYTFKDGSLITSGSNTTDSGASAQ